MADIFESGLSALKLITKVYEIKIDNGTFKLFYKATTALLLACSFISSSKQFFGTPISCEVVRIFFVCGKKFIFSQKIRNEISIRDRFYKHFLHPIRPFTLYALLFMHQKVSPQILTFVKSTPDVTTASEDSCLFS